MDYPKIGAWLSLAIIIVALAALAGCTATDSAKTSAYRYVAERGNGYCDRLNEGPLRDVLLEKVNRGLKEQGARWSIAGIDCE